MPARVSITPECASQPDTAVGIAGCLLTPGRTYAPKAKIGFLPSFWGRDATTVGNFMLKLGADKADFMATGMRATSRHPTSAKAPTVFCDHKCRSVWHTLILLLSL